MTQDFTAQNASAHDGAEALRSLPCDRPLLELTQSPYQGAFARAALDAALAFAAFAQNPVIAFSGDGVLALVEGQKSTAIGRKSLRKVIDSLPLYDVDTVFVDDSALARWGVSSSALPDFARVLDDAQLGELRSRARHIVSL